MSGDYQLEDTLYFPFTTRQFSDGVPTVLSGGVVEIYEDDSVTQITVAETLSTPDSIAGFNMLKVVATAANGFGAGQSYSAILTAGTVGGVSVIGEMVAHFTLDKSAAAKDLANATDGLGALRTLALDIPTVAEFNARTLVAASYFDPVADAVANVTTVATTTTNTDMRGTDSALTDKAGFSLSTPGILAIWHQALAAIVTASSIGKLIKDEITAVRMATLTDWINGGRLDNILDARMAEASIATTGGAVDTVTTNTDMRGTDSAALASVCTEPRLAELDAANLPTDVAANATPAEVLTQVNAALDTAIAELAQAAPSATPTLRTGLMLLYMALRNRLDVNTSGAPDVLNIYNNAGTVIAKKQLTDDGSDYSEVEMETGP